MSESPQAVFLSYASEDVEAAQRICEALRGAGIEAWLDKSELRGGDAWDQKIRRQIRDCTLFMPLISATTNARAEGYFRLEWRLAVDRSLLMADDEPFLFPVAIDESGETESRVPDRFREVQWMRLDRDSPEAIAARVGKLLAKEAKSERARTRTAERRRGPLRYVWVGIGLLFALVAVVKPLVSPKRDREPPAATASHASEAARLARRAIDVTKSIDYTREGLAAAADDARRASEADPSLALAWGARARVEATWINRVWDQSENRRRSTHEFAKRALALDAEEPNALWGQGVVLFVQGALPEAEATFRRGLKASPDDNHIRRSLATVCDLRGRHEESAALLEEAIRRDPRDPLNHYNLALNTLYDRANSQDSAKVDLALAHFDRALEIQPIASALLWKIHIQAALKGDLEAANATLGRLAALPLEQATEERAIFYRMWIPLLQQQPGKALSAAGLTTTTYFSDLLVAGPIGWLKAAAHRQAKRESAATEELRAAETVLRARLASSPDALRTQAELAVTMALLGRKDDAAKQFERFDKSMREKGTPGTLLHVKFYSAMRDAKRAAAAIRGARSPATANSRTVPLWMTEAVLSRDPWFDGVRGQPEFKALLQEIATPK